ncbi:MAG: hypothetical protein WC632_00845 [Candidatus Margulisiibacteriota bacterium]
MKKIITCLVIGSCLASVSLAAVKATAKTTVKAPVNATAEVTTVAPPLAVVQPVAPRKKGGLLVEGNFEGGTGVVELGYLLPFPGDINRDLKINLGYGLGNKYNVTVARLSLTNVMAGWLVGLSIDYGNYSVPVQKMPIIGEITKGGMTGVGITLGKNLGRYKAKAGYSTALGLIAGLEYRF